MFISHDEKSKIQNDVANHQETISILAIDLFHLKENIASLQQSEKQIDELIKICKGMNARIAKLEGVKMADRRKLPKSPEVYEKQRLAMKKYWAEKKAKKESAK